MADEHLYIYRIGCVRGEKNIMLQLPEPHHAMNKSAKAWHASEEMLYGANIVRSCLAA